MTTAQDQQSRAEFQCGIAAASVLRAMAMNYQAGHAWDALDERACINAANEIDRLNAELQAARALPAGMEPVAEVLSSRSGNDTSVIDKAMPTGTKLYTAAQVQSMLEHRRRRCGDDAKSADTRMVVCRHYGPRLPPGWQAAPQEPAESQLAAVRQKPHPTNPNGWDVNHRRIYREMLAAAPRPPAAQEVPSDALDAIRAAGMQGHKPLTEERIRQLDDETHFHESHEWPVRFARAIEAAHGIK